MSKIEAGAERVKAGDETAPAEACCSVTEQATCCEAEVKALCCGPATRAPAAPGAPAKSSCGCR